MSAVTIQDVANHAGVSRATVSRVLNNSEGVSDDLRERVLEATNQLGYQPNRAARRLRSRDNTADVLGLIVSDIENPFFISVLRGVEDAAYANQKSIIVCDTDEDPDKLRMYLNVMQAERVGGLIVAPTHLHDGVILNEYRREGMPIILLDRSIENCEFDTVLVDNVHGSHTATTHLINLGYERIGIICGSSHLTTASERYTGYLNALRAAGMPINDHLIKIGDFKSESGYHLTKELMQSSHPPDALFVTNSLMTLGALNALFELGVRVPEDLAFISFDDLPWIAGNIFALTCVAQPSYEIGQEAFRLLLRRLNDPSASTTSVVLRTRLIVRKSCGATLLQK